MNQWPSSPSVSPCRIGIGPAPTKLSQPGRNVSPSIGRPAGLGRSSTQTYLPCCRRRFEHIEQRGDEGVDAAAEILQVDQHHVERVHRLPGRPPHLAVEAEHRDAVDRIGEIGRFDHIVLLVAAQAVLRPEGGGDVHARRDQRVEGVRQVRGHRSGMREQGDALALRAARAARGRRAGGRYRISCALRAGSSSAKQSAWWKSGFARRVRQRPKGFGPVPLLDHCGQAQCQHPLVGSRQTTLESIRQVQIATLEIYRWRVGSGRASAPGVSVAIVEPIGGPTRPMAKN